jgi:hypothetical protein
MPKSRPEVLAVISPLLHALLYKGSSARGSLSLLAALVISPAHLPANPYSSDVPAVIGQGNNKRTSRTTILRLANWHNTNTNLQISYALANYT